MKKIITILLVSLPAGAQAMGMHGEMRGCAPTMGVHLAVGLYAVLAALGYLVLQHAVKETAKCSKFAGRLVGWVLIAAGLAGMLCGVAAHARMAGCCHKCEMRGQMMQREEMQEMTEGKEEMGGKKTAPEMKAAAEAKAPAAKKPEAAPKKK